MNCSYASTLSQNVQANETTTSTTTNSVNASFGIKWTPLTDVLELQVRRRLHAQLREVVGLVQDHRTLGSPAPGGMDRAPPRDAYGAQQPRVLRNAIGKVLNNDGTPSGQYVADDRRVNSSDAC
ncbi:hypothetical protein ABZ646_09275 [Streptomyces sp. NPDC007162]|uniref:hypothetical protein n=1 Tax=Streptomyces sp. NPDC007162 TaxID=3156917 RepID=UPI00340C0DFB